MRRLLTPRWLGLHVLAVVLLLTCCWLGWWQLGRGFQGSARSFAYALQWPCFGAFVAVMWWRVVRDSRPGGAPAEPGGPDGSAGGQGPAAVPAPGRPVLHTRPTPDPGEQDEELARYNAYLAALDRRPGRR